MGGCHGGLPDSCGWGGDGGPEVERPRRRAALLSLELCLASWNDAKAGVVIDLLILVGLVIATWVLRHAVA